MARQSSAKKENERERKIEREREKEKQKEKEKSIISQENNVKMESESYSKESIDNARILMARATTDLISILTDDKDDRTAEDELKDSKDFDKIYKTLVACNGELRKIVLTIKTLGRKVGLGEIPVASLKDGRSKYIIEYLESIEDAIGDKLKPKSNNNGNNSNNKNNQNNQNNNKNNNKNNTNNNSNSNNNNNGNITSNAVNSLLANPDWTNVLFQTLQNRNGTSNPLSGLVAKLHSISGAGTNVNNVKNVNNIDNGNKNSGGINGNVNNRNNVNNVNNGNNINGNNNNSNIVNVTNNNTATHVNHGNHGNHGRNSNNSSQNSLTPAHTMSATAAAAAHQSRKRSFSNTNGSTNNMSGNGNGNGNGHGNVGNLIPAAKRLKTGATRAQIVHGNIQTSMSNLPQFSKLTVPLPTVPNVSNIGNTGSVGSSMTPTNLATSMGANMGPNMGISASMAQSMGAAGMQQSIGQAIQHQHPHPHPHPHGHGHPHQHPHSIQTIPTLGAHPSFTTRPMFDPSLVMFFVVMYFVKMNIYTF